MFTADVFIDPSHNGTPNTRTAIWRSVLVGALRQGGRYVYALDVTQPDQIDAAGVKTAAKDHAPDCLNGGGSVHRQLSERDVGAHGRLHRSPERRASAFPRWARRGRVRSSAGSRLVNGVAPEDHYVAIFGGGFDPTYTPGRSRSIHVGPNATRGRAIYVVDIETGKILYKTTQGQDSEPGRYVDFAPMPAPPAVVGLQRRRIPRRGLHRRRERTDVASRPHRPMPRATPKKGELVAGADPG